MGGVLGDRVEAEHKVQGQVAARQREGVGGDLKGLASPEGVVNGRGPESTLNGHKVGGSAEGERSLVGAQRSSRGQGPAEGRGLRGGAVEVTEEEG